MATLAVTSSPTRPSPRVAAWTYRPLSYRRLIASPSIFSSHTNLAGASPRLRRDAVAPRVQLVGRHRVVEAGHRDGVDDRREQHARRAADGASTGDSSTARSGFSASSCRSSRTSRSKSPSLISGSSSSWYRGCGRRPGPGARRCDRRRSSGLECYELADQARRRGRTAPRSTGRGRGGRCRAPSGTPARRRSTLWTPSPQCGVIML